MSRLNVIFLFLFVALLVWVTLFEPKAVSRIQNGAMTLFRPLMQASSRLGSGVEAVGTESLSPAQLRVVIADLERERDRLKLEAIQLDEIARENIQLRHALQYVEKAPLSVIAARVINRKPGNWYNTMVIDKGSASGVIVDSPVIVPVGEDAGLVGKVSEVVGENTAVVLLLTDEMCQVSARLENSQEQGILNGQRGALHSLPSLRLRYLSKEADAAPGRRVVSSGAGGLFPPDLLLGEITALEIGAIDAEASVKASVNFEELVDVFVVLPATGEFEEEATSPKEEEPAPSTTTDQPALPRES